jgi:hypothetical protein
MVIQGWVTVALKDLLAWDLRTKQLKHTSALILVKNN